MKKQISQNKKTKHKKVEKKKTKKQENDFKDSFFLFLKIFSKIFLYVFSGMFFLALAFFVYINLPVGETLEPVKIGTTFSLRYAQDIGLDWKQAYLAMLDDLGIKHIRLPVYWDRVERIEGEYDFSDIDWQLQEAAARDIKITLAFGQKVPRWPECFVPDWIGSDDGKRKQKLLEFEKVVVERYKNNHSEIVRWQVENEPFLDFGVCPPIDVELVDDEVALVRRLDASRPIVMTDGGEATLWIQAAGRADIFGSTMYREVISPRFGHWKYPIGPNFFKAKLFLIDVFVNQKNAIVIELQGEPWIRGWTTAAPLEIQLESMNAEKLSDNVSFAKKTGMKEVYIWGVEWWYWLKTNQNNDTLWEQAKIITQANSDSE
ncbi:MAG: cellulase family glycosylhydrolase [Candidatus Moranbacteria bacterium]|nr:cellulase family glycosylhydrolase [Candidatus Moranbacteria bacterium]